MTKVSQADLYLCYVVSSLFTELNFAFHFLIVYIDTHSIYLNLVESMLFTFCQI